MDLTGVFIQVTKGKEQAYTYILYERSYDEIMAKKNELNEHLTKAITRSNAIGTHVRIAYFDLGYFVGDRDCVFSATESDVLLDGVPLHPNPYKTRIQTIPHTFHDTKSQQHTVSVLSTINDTDLTKENLFEKLSKLKR